MTDTPTGGPPIPETEFTQERIAKSLDLLQRAVDHVHDAVQYDPAQAAHKLFGAVTERIVELGQLNRQSDLTNMEYVFRPLRLALQRVQKKCTAEPLPDGDAVRSVVASIANRTDWLPDTHDDVVRLVADVTTPRSDTVVRLSLNPAEYADALSNIQMIIDNLGDLLRVSRIGADLLAHPDDRITAALTRAPGAMAAIRAKVSAVAKGALARVPKPKLPKLRDKHQGSDPGMPSAETGVMTDGLTDPPTVLVKAGEVHVGEEANNTETVPTDPRIAEIQKACGAWEQTIRGIPSSPVRNQALVAVGQLKKALTAGQSLDALESLYAAAAEKMHAVGGAVVSFTPPTVELSDTAPAEAVTMEAVTDPNLAYAALQRYLEQHQDLPQNDHRKISGALQRLDAAIEGSNPEVIADAERLVLDTYHGLPDGIRRTAMREHAVTSALSSSPIATAVVKSDAPSTDVSSLESLSESALRAGLTTLFGAAMINFKLATSREMRYTPHTSPNKYDKEFIRRATALEVFRANDFVGLNAGTIPFALTCRLITIKSISDQQLGNLRKLYPTIKIIREGEEDQVSDVSLKQAIHAPVIALPADTITPMSVTPSADIQHRLASLSGEIAGWAAKYKHDTGKLSDDLAVARAALEAERAANEKVVHDLGITIRSLREQLLAEGAAHATERDALVAAHTSERDQLLAKLATADERIQSLSRPVAASKMEPLMESLDQVRIAEAAEDAAELQRLHTLIADLRQELIIYSKRRILELGELKHQHTRHDSNREQRHAAEIRSYEEDIAELNTQLFQAHERTYAAQQKVIAFEQRLIVAEGWQVAYEYITEHLADLERTFHEDGHTIANLKRDVTRRDALIADQNGQIAGRDERMEYLQMRAQQVEGVLNTIGQLIDRKPGEDWQVALQRYGRIARLKQIGDMTRSAQDTPASNAESTVEDARLRQELLAAVRAVHAVVPELQNRTFDEKSSLRELFSIYQNGVNMIAKHDKASRSAIEKALADILGTDNGLTVYDGSGIGLHLNQVAHLIQELRTTKTETEQEFAELQREHASTREVALKVLRVLQSMYPDLDSGVDIDAPLSDLVHAVNRYISEMLSDASQSTALKVELKNLLGWDPDGDESLEAALARYRGEGIEGRVVTDGTAITDLDALEHVEPNLLLSLNEKLSDSALISHLGDRVRLIAFGSGPVSDLTRVVDATFMVHNDGSTQDERELVRRMTNVRRITISADKLLSTHPVLPMPKNTTLVLSGAITQKSLDILTEQYPGWEIRATVQAAPRMRVDRVLQRRR